MERRDRFWIVEKGKRLVSILEPRALPWAELFGPFRAKPRGSWRNTTEKPRGGNHARYSPFFSTPQAHAFRSPEAHHKDHKTPKPTIISVTVNHDVATQHGSLRCTCSLSRIFNLISGINSPSSREVYSPFASFAQWRSSRASSRNRRWLVSFWRRGFASEERCPARRRRIYRWASARGRAT